MGPNMRRSYYMYGMGLSPEIMTLGTLVWKDYANPHLAPKCIFRSLSEDELKACASSSAVSGTFTGTSTHAPHASLNLADIVEFESSWQSEKQQVLVAGGGSRQELIDPSHFFSTTVLSDPNAIKTVKLWLSVARCKYLLNRAAFRKPKIWMLSGLYLLHDVRAYDMQKVGPKLSAGISPQVSALAGGVPIGGSAGFEWEKGLQADLQVPDANVWAAQWRRLDVEYLLDEEVQATDRPSPLRYGLYPDVTSQGVLRSHDPGMGQSWRAAVGPTLDDLTKDASSESLDSQEGHVLGVSSGDMSEDHHSSDTSHAHEEYAPGIEVENESSRIYDRSFQEALDWLIGEIDDDE